MDADTLTQLLEEAAQAHHEYEQNELSGNRDEQWARWYAEYVVSRLQGAN